MLDGALVGDVAGLGETLSAQGSEGIAYDLDPALTCPSPAQLRSALEAQVRALAAPGENDWLDRLTLRVRAGPVHALVVELLDPLSQVSFRRSIPKGGCEAQAEAVALLVLSWIAKSASAPEAEIARPVVISRTSAISPEPSPAVGPSATDWRLSLEPRLSGGGLLAQTPSPLGGAIEGSLQLYLTRRWGVAARASWFTPLRASDPSSAGSMELRRYAVGFDLSWTGRPLPTAMDVALGLQDEIDQTEPTGFAHETPAVTHTPQLHIAVRYRWALVSRLFAYLEGSGTFGPWPHRFLAADASGEVQLLTLPAIQAALALGLGWHFL